MLTEPTRSVVVREFDTKKERKLIIAGNWENEQSRRRKHSTLHGNLKTKIADVHIVALPLLNANRLAPGNPLAPHSCAVDLITTLTSYISLLV